MPGRTQLVPAFGVYQEVAPNKSAVEYYRRVHEEFKRLEIVTRTLILEEAIRYLKEKYPAQNYRVVVRGLGGKKYYIFMRGDKRSRESYQEIPFWVRVEDGEVFIPASYVRRNKKLAGLVVGYRMEAIRLAMNKVLKREEEEEKKEEKVEEKKEEVKVEEVKKRAEKEIKKVEEAKKEDAKKVEVPREVRVRRVKNPIVRCPRCGQMGHVAKKWVKNKRGERYEYFYVYHKIPIGNGKYKTKWCYLGRNIPSKLLAGVA